MHIPPLKNCVFVHREWRDEKYAKEIKPILTYLSEIEKDMSENYACDFVSKKSQKGNFRVNGPSKAGVWREIGWNQTAKPETIDTFWITLKRYFATLKR